MKRAVWYRKIFNADEPENDIRIIGELVENTYIPFEIFASLNFRDGSFLVYIHRELNGKFVWTNDRESGIVESFEEAWTNLPSFVTNPDDWEESDFVQIYEAYKA